ncbi:MAG: hypothetical protein ACRD1C_14445 [Terriglobales bacterium]
MKSRNCRTVADVNALVKSGMSAPAASRRQHGRASRLRLARA